MWLAEVVNDNKQISVLKNPVLSTGFLFPPSPCNFEVYSTILI